MNGMNENDCAYVFSLHKLYDIYFPRHVCTHSAANIRTGHIVGRVFTELSQQIERYLLAKVILRRGCKNDILSELSRKMKNLYIGPRL